MSVKIKKESLYKHEACVCSVDEAHIQLISLPTYDEAAAWTAQHWHSQKAICIQLYKYKAYDVSAANLTIRRRMINRDVTHGVDYRTLLKPQTDSHH